MAVRSQIPTEQDRDTPEHWSFEKYLYLVRGWVPHHIPGRWFYNYEGGMVPVYDEMVAHKTWEEAVRKAWREGTAINAEATADFPFMRNKAVRNGMWIFAPIRGVSS
jgi:hypothetical protein